MKDDTSVIPFRQPESIEDPLTEIAREGARRMLATAMEAEIAVFIEQFAEERLPDGRQRVVRHGYGPEREIQTGIGPLAVRRPKVRDRAASGDDGERIRFTSHILPKWARRSRSLDALLPVLYLRRHLHRRLPGSPVRPRGARRSEPVTERHLKAHG